jgi:hypothetical protein
MMLPPTTRWWLLFLGAALLVRPSSAVTCDSHTDITTCNASVDGSVVCTWAEGKCGNGEARLADGMVGTTSVEQDPMDAMDPMDPMDNEPQNLSAERVKGLVDALNLDSSFCDLKPDQTGQTGVSCSAYMPMWWYNSTSGMCEEYIYGGCSKTDNLFDFEVVCVAAATAYCPPVAGPAGTAGAAAGPGTDAAVTAEADAPKEPDASAVPGPTSSDVTDSATGLAAGIGLLGGVLLLV